MNGVLSTHALRSTNQDIQAQGMFQSSLLSILLYDHALTLGDEVDKIWNLPFASVSVLFVLNRYLTPLVFMVTLVAYQSEWSAEICQRFVKYEGAGCAVVMAICQIVMILRVNALYAGNRLVLLLLVTLFMAQVGIHAAVITEALQKPIAIGCVLAARSSIYEGIWIVPLVADSLIIILTLWKLRKYSQGGGRMPTMHRFLRDGIAHFVVIFSVNLLNVVVYFSVEDESTKNLFGSFSEVLTSMTVSRIILSLRGYRPHGAGATTFADALDVSDQSLAFADPWDMAILYQDQEPAMDRDRSAGSDCNEHDWHTTNNA